jgi:hypothetical protein
MNQHILILFGFLAVTFILLAAIIGVPTAILYSPIKILLLIIALAFDVLAFSSRRYSYLIVPLFKQRRKRIVLSNEEPYIMSTSEDAIIRKEGDEYIATVYISIPIYRSATEMDESGKVEFSRQISRLIGISTDPIRFTSEMYVMDKDSYIQSLRDAISMAEEEEAKLSQSNADEKKIEMVRGKIAMWRNILQNSTVESSLELVSYAAISAAGGKEYEAISLAQQKAREAMSGIGSTFGVTPSIVTGKEILKFVEPEYLVPFSTAEEEIEEKAEEAVI